MEKRLYKDQLNKKIGGVCAGLAEYFHMDVTLIRVLFVLSLILHGSGFLLYVILWICLPKKPYVFGTPGVDYTVPPTPFGDMQQPPFAAYGNVPKTRSNAGIIVGAVLIIIGGLTLADQLNIIPDFDFDYLWPLILVAVGCGLIFSRGTKQPWEHDNWNNPTHTGPAGPEAKTDENNTNDNHPTA